MSLLFLFGLVGVRVRLRGHFIIFAGSSFSCSFNYLVVVVIVVAVCFDSFEALKRHINFKSRPKERNVTNYSVIEL